MRRRPVGLLMVGWLLGLLTAFVWPAVATERQTVVVMNSGGFLNSPETVARRTRDGWVVTRVDAMGQGASAVQLERPRYVSVYEDLQERPRGSWCWLTKGDWYR